jgi:hypothetical protein
MRPGYGASRQEGRRLRAYYARQRRATDAAAKVRAMYWPTEAVRLYELLQLALQALTEAGSAAVMEIAALVRDYGVSFEDLLETVERWERCRWVMRRFHVREQELRREAEQWRVVEELRRD